MPRIKGALNARKNHKKILKMAKGHYGARSTQFKTAKQSVLKAMSNAYIGRKQKKRQYRALWITRINAAVREQGLSYSKFMNGLKLANIEIDRKVLADMAVNDVNGFTKLIETAKSNLK